MKARCEQCGMWYEKARHWQRWCSVKCREDNFKMRRKVAKQMEREAARARVEQARAEVGE